MADNNYGGTDEENAEIRRLNMEIENDPDNFESWEKLIHACSLIEGGLNRNSSPIALATVRDSYDRLLLKFPLMFGYWKKYADWRFNVDGPEAAEIVYERGCASITNSVDLWTEFCAFKMETTHEPQPVRELFERGAEHVGLDFLAHPFWDKYIEYEDRLEASDKVFSILKRVIAIPMHQYARYYERFRQMVPSQPLADLVPAELLARLQAEVDAEAAQYDMARSPVDIEVAVRGKIDAYYYEVFAKTQLETNKRWQFESEIKRPYFHVTELEYLQLANWHKYLDFEEEQGDYARIVALYERCLVTCALYEEFWFRYARWLADQPGKEEDVRIVYLRASTVFVPISRPGVRLQLAYLEESNGRLDVARDLHAVVLDKLPDSAEVMISWAHMERRQGGLEAAIEVLKQQICQTDVDLYAKAPLVVTWAHMLLTIKGSVDEARAVYAKNVGYYADSQYFWQKWLDFELTQPSSLETEPQQFEHIDTVFRAMQTHSRLPAAAKRELTQSYLTYLQQRGGKDAMAHFLATDRDMFGPVSVSIAGKLKAKTKEAGAEPMAELDEADLPRAQARFPNYYELFSEPSPVAQGPAPYQ